MAITREVFLRDDIPIVFEVGYRTSDGCDYVFVPDPNRGHLEFITSDEIYFTRDRIDSVQTRPDVWYDVDKVVFAKEIGPYKQGDSEQLTV